MPQVSDYFPGSRLLGERLLSAFLRLIRFARLAALIADLWTILYAVLIIGWQIVIFFREGSWSALSIKVVLDKLEYGHHVGYTTAQIRENEGSGLLNAVDALLHIPAIVPLLLAAALLTAFYKWLKDFERQYFGSRN